MMGGMTGAEIPPDTRLKKRLKKILILRFGEVYGAGEEGAQYDLTGFYEEVDRLVTQYLSELPVKMKLVLVE